MKKTLSLLAMSVAAIPAYAGFILSPEVQKMQQDAENSKLNLVLTTEKESISPTSEEMAKLKNKTRVEFYEKICAASGQQSQVWIAAVPNQEKDLSLIAIKLMEPTELKSSAAALLNLAPNTKELYTAKSLDGKTVFRHTKNIPLKTQEASFSYESVDTSPSLCEKSDEYEDSLFKDVIPVLLEQYLASRLSKEWKHSSNVGQGVILFETHVPQKDEEVLKTLKEIAQPYLQTKTIINKEASLPKTPEKAKAPRKESSLVRWIFMQDAKTYYLTKEENEASTVYQLYVVDKSKK